MIASLFPAGVVTVEATEDMWAGPLYPEEAACIQRAVLKRRREFTAGRACVRRALAQLGIENFPLLPNQDRAPIWPPGVVGSISHCQDYCGVAVAHRGAVVSLGLDVERAIPLDQQLLPRVCTPSELARLPGLSARERAAWAKIVFSAKESTYKCYYPLVGTMLEFQDLHVALNPRDGVFTARLVRAEAAPAAGFRTFRGRFVSDHAYVYTAVTLMAGASEDDVETACGLA